MRHLPRLKKTWVIACVATLVLLSHVSLDAVATSTVIEIKAIIKGIVDPGWLPFAIDVGDTLSGYYTYDVDAMDLDPDTHRGFYEYTSPPTALVVYADAGWVFRTDDANTLVRFTIGDSLVLANGNGPADIYRFQSVYNRGYSEEEGHSLQMGFMQIDLVDSSLTANANDQLPTGPPDLADWQNRRLLLITGPGLDWIIYAEVISFDLPTSVDENPPGMKAWLGANRPNPFNPSTTIPFSLEHPAYVKLYVYDIAGRLIRRLVDETLPGGRHEVRWDGRDAGGLNVASGTYLYQLQVNGHSVARKATLLK